METASGETLTYNFEIAQYSTVSLISAVERTLTDEELEEILDGPVNISIKYSKIGTSEPITLNCLEGHQFDVSH